MGEKSNPFPKTFLENILWLKAGRKSVSETGGTGTAREWFCQNSTRCLGGASLFPYISRSAGMKKISRCSWLKKWLTVEVKEIESRGSEVGIHPCLMAWLVLSCCTRLGRSLSICFEMRSYFQSSENALYTCIASISIVGASEEFPSMVLVNTSTDVTFFWVAYGGEFTSLHVMYITLAKKKRRVFQRELSYFSRGAVLWMKILQANTISHNFESRPRRKTRRRISTRSLCLGGQRRAGVRGRKDCSSGHCMFLLCQCHRFPNACSFAVVG